MRSEQAQIGAKVRVGYSGRCLEWRGLTGTVSRKWGNPEYLALDVLLEDGRTLLFCGTASSKSSLRARNSRMAGKAGCPSGGKW